MATKYTFNFSDTGKAPFDLQAYTRNGPESPSNPAIIPGASTANTTLKLWGKGNDEYGEPVFQDLIYMLENFSNSTRPVFSIEGQLWYNNVGVSSSPELFIRNSNPDDTYGGSPFISAGWDAIILATGSSAMTGELILSGNPTNVLAAVPKQYIDSHTTDFSIHLTPDQNTFLDTLSLPTLTALEVDQLIGIGTSQTVQAQLDGKLNLTGGTLFPAANIILGGGGEILGLPATPSSTGAATSQQYVLDQLAALNIGDGVLTSTDWVSVALGSPPIALNETTLRFNITIPGSPPTITTIDAKGISRFGHTHQAADVLLDNSFDISYGSTTQSGIEQAAAEIALLKGDTTPQATIIVERIFDSLIADITTGALFQTQLHTTDDNRVSLTINGVKQYSHSHATQEIIYDTSITPSSATGLDAIIAYDFDISIDGGANTTITINNGSPSTAIDTHEAMILAINDELTTNGVNAIMLPSAAGEIFKTRNAGVGNTISITDPGATPATYLFNTDPTPGAIIAATFLSNSSGGSPAVPDDITIAGDVTASFPVGKTFTIRGSVDATYGTYDGVYSVHANTAQFDTTNTIIPIALVSDPTLNVPLLPLYDPNGSPTPPAPSPSPFGDVYLSSLGGIVSVATPTAGIEGDYMEVTAAGSPALLFNSTEYVVFNYDIITGSKIESLLYV